jgi:gpW
MPAIIASQALLTDARQKYHALVTGVSPRVVVDANGERVEFTGANKQALYNYITQLEAQLGAGCGQAPALQTQYGPAGFTF